jgi:hypothetical protein
MSLPHFHGKGFELREDKFEDYCDGPAYKKGTRINWGIDFTSMKSMLPLPIKLDEEFKITDDFMKYKVHEYKDIPVLLNARRKYTLDEAFRAVLWELSFYGTEEEKMEKKEQLDDSMADLCDADGKLLPIEVLEASGKVKPIDALRGNKDGE